MFFGLKFISFHRMTLDSRSQCTLARRQTRARLALEVLPAGKCPLTRPVGVLHTGRRHLLGRRNPRGGTRVGSADAVASG